MRLQEQLTSAADGIEKEREDYKEFCQSCGDSNQGDRIFQYGTDLGLVLQLLMHGAW